MAKQAVAIEVEEQDAWINEKFHVGFMEVLNHNHLTLESKMKASVEKQGVDTTNLEELAERISIMKTNDGTSHLMLDGKEIAYFTDLLIGNLATNELLDNKTTTTLSLTFQYVDLF